MNQKLIFLIFFLTSYSVFSYSQERLDGNLKLETEADYRAYEDELIQAYNWLLATPIDIETDKRKDVSAFILKWISGSPYVTVELSAEIITYMDCGECLLMFMGGWTKYAIENKEFDNAYKGNLAGTESVIEFYEKNRSELGKIKEVEKLSKLKDKNKLEKFIQSNI